MRVTDRKPDFANVEAVLERRRPDRPTLFEFFLNEPLYGRLAEGEDWERGDHLDRFRFLIAAFHNAGYDYATLHGSEFHFPTAQFAQQNTRSINDGSVIHDRESLAAYQWLEPEDFATDPLGEVGADLPPGMKLVVCGPGGVLENTFFLVGYDRLCYLIADDPEVAQAVFDGVGSRLVRYYQQVVRYDTVGAIISNDDWGFKTQTMLSPAVMRRYVFPWHRRIVEVAHAAGKPAILHSCGQLEAVMEDVIEDMGFDGKHSYEDAICPVEEAYERWGERIAILGGLDLDFVVRSTPERVRERARRMLERTAGRGSYGLGTGNSVPEYVPDENYLAMTAAAFE